MAVGRKRRTYQRLYWPNCAVCQYMKKNKEFRYDVMQSTYFNVNGSESLMDVNYRYGAPFKPAAMYMHMKRHQQNDIIKAEELAAQAGEKLPTRSPNRTGLPAIEIIESRVGSTERHEQGLDDFIATGRDKLAKGELTINATSFLQAIKIKADIEKSTKDRRADVVKSFFGTPGRTATGPEGTSQN